jgi:hypothetical protein
MKPEAQTLHKKFLEIKHTFDGKGTLKHNIQLPSGMGTDDRREKGIMNGSIVLSTSAENDSMPNLPGVLRIWADNGSGTTCAVYLNIPSKRPWLLLRLRSVW